MDQLLNCVSEFHQAIGAPIAAAPTLLPGDAAQAAALAVELRAIKDRAKQRGMLGELLFVRLALALEELAEWLEAHANSDLVAAADAWGDRLYVLLGDAVSAGMPGAAIFEEIHRSNMTKASRPVGADGKAVKPGSYLRPRLADAIAGAGVGVTNAAGVRIGNSSMHG